MLEQFLAEASRSPIVWSVNDCAMMLANWWHRKHGVDPAVDLRGTYATEQECEELVVRKGGILAVVREIAEGVEATPTDRPVRGDIGVIEVHGTVFAAILGPSGRWMVKADRGMAGHRCGFLMAWSV